MSCFRRLLTLRGFRVVLVTCLIGKVPENTFRKPCSKKRRSVYHTESGMSITRLSLTPVFYHVGGSEVSFSAWSWTAFRRHESESMARANRAGRKFRSVERWSQEKCGFTEDCREDIRQILPPSFFRETILTFQNINKFPIETLAQSFFPMVYRSDLLGLSPSTARHPASSAAPP